MESLLKHFALGFSALLPVVIFTTAFDRHAVRAFEPAVYSVGPLKCTFGLWLEFRYHGYRVAGTLQLLPMMNRQATAARPMSFRSAPSRSVSTAISPPSSASIFRLVYLVIFRPGLRAKRPFPTKLLPLPMAKSRSRAVTRSYQS